MTVTPLGPRRRTNDPTPLITYMRVQRATDRELIAALTRTTNGIQAELTRLAARGGVGAAVRREQLLLTQAAIQTQLAAYWRGLGNTVLAARADAAAAATRHMMTPGLLAATMPKGDVAALMRAAEEQARAGIDTLQARVNLSRIPLSDQVYRTADLVDGTIDDIINQAIARGASANELARDVRRYIRPDTRGGVRYAALRLARTELNNAFHAQQITSAIANPWVTALRWNLSGSHPKPDLCNVYAEDRHSGGGAGLWKPEDVPGKPHPNCLCYLTPETPPRNEFIERFRAGQYDSAIDDLLSSGSAVIR